uniref:NADH-ubiquinone oxidoreductase chain 6 n=1 Tax=Ochthebius remotus TaxID=1309317 RepID=A0A7H0DJZ9_9COLE|nr:NADH dehydrogenase subunit 6 [Ochthebius remotus]QNP09659.1 NADH dehydrogenase subunit 6 [Ochthebius remotus]
MLMYLLLLNYLFSMLFIFMSHPLSMGLMLLIQVILISLITGFLNFNFWFSYILFLVMIGGMLVLFIYMTSIASNEKFKINTNLILFIMLFMLLSIMLMLTDNFLYNLTSFNKYIMINSEYYTLSKFYNMPSNTIMFMLIIYLLITLIAIVKITNFKMGPLRQKF